MTENRVQRMLLRVAGTNERVLADVPTDTNKQSALGAVILTTAALASVSAFMALQMALDFPWPVALVGAIFWGWAILNLDRWLVVSTARQAKKRHSIFMGLPRVLLALIIGAVVSTPLTLNVFGDEINTQLQVIKTREAAEFERQLQTDPRFASLAKDEAKIEELQNQIAQGVPGDAVLKDPQVKDLSSRLLAAETEYRAAEKAVMCEKEGTCGSGTPGAGPASAEKIAARDRLRAEVNDLREQLDQAKEQAKQNASTTAASLKSDRQAALASLQTKVATAQKQRDAEMAAHQQMADDADGLLARIGALHELEQSDPNMQLAHIVLFLFLTCLELLPTLFKLLQIISKPSAYELALRTYEEHQLARLKLRLATIHSEAKDAADFARKSSMSRAKTQRKAQERAARAVLDAQLELTKESLATWRAEQAAALREVLPAHGPSVPQQPVSHPVMMTKPVPETVGQSPGPWLS